MWASNAIVGRLVHDMISPFALNFVRWLLACLLLLPLAWRVLRSDSVLWQHWRAYAVLGLLGIGCYNSLLYLALKTSSPLNATLVGWCSRAAISKCCRGCSWCPVTCSCCWPR